MAFIWVAVTTAGWFYAIVVRPIREAAPWWQPVIGVLLTVAWVVFHAVIIHHQMIMFGGW